MKSLKKNSLFVTFLIYHLLVAACSSPQREAHHNSEINRQTVSFLHPPLVKEHYTADPSAHVFEGRIYIYPSHDIETGIPSDGLGSHFGMRDYRVYSMDKPEGIVTDRGTVLHLEEIAWASGQLWAPDAAEKNGRYYLYFPAKDQEGIFRIGVAVSDRPDGPFLPNPEPIKGTYSIDPAVFRDSDGTHYIYWGGIWGGQLQKWRNNHYRPVGQEPTDGIPENDEPALLPIIAKLNDNMVELAEEPREVQLLDSAGNLLLAGDNQRRFFEAAWLHKYGENYYFSYSTGDTHFIAYAVGNNPYGPFTYKGNILNPVQGWTTHHSIVSFENNWYLFYHDTEISGETHLRNMKMSPLKHLEDGTIELVEPMKK